MNKLTKRVKSLAQRFVGRLGYEIRPKSESMEPVPRPCAVDIAIASLSTRGKLSFVQVGANDGKLEDPIYQHVLAHGSKVMLIEPQPWLIEALTENYKTFTGALMIENIAIGPEDGTLALHILKKEFWAEYSARDGRSPTILFSPDRNLLRRRIARRMAVDVAEAEKRLDVIEVPMQPLSDVMARHGFDDVDLLQIDCEGYDIQVILSLGGYRPALINFESFSLSETDKKLFMEWCKEKGYGFVQGSKDTLAIRGFGDQFYIGSNPFNPALSSDEKLPALGS